MWSNTISISEADKKSIKSLRKEMVVSLEVYQVGKTSLIPKQPFMKAQKKPHQNNLSNRNILKLADQTINFIEKQLNQSIDKLEGHYSSTPSHSVSSNNSQKSLLIPKGMRSEEKLSKISSILQNTFIKGRDLSPC